MFSPPRLGITPDLSVAPPAGLRPASTRSSTSARRTAGSNQARCAQRFRESARSLGARGFKVVQWSAVFDEQVRDRPDDTMAMLRQVPIDLVEQMRFKN